MKPLTKEGGLLISTKVLIFNVAVWSRLVASWPTHSGVTLIIFPPEEVKC